MLPTFVTIASVSALLTRCRATGAASGASVKWQIYSLFYIVSKLFKYLSQDMAFMVSNCRFTCMCIYGVCVCVCVCVVCEYLTF